MRLVFLGASRFGLRCLEAVRGLSDWDVIGVVTAPQRFSISYRPEGVVNVLYADVGSYCRQRSIQYSVIGHGMMSDALFETVCAWRPDAFLVVGWYHMVPAKWRALAPAYGLHASLLPDYSGGAPLVWAMINGEKKTGITLFELADGVDNGPILGQAETRIADDDTIATLYARIEEAGLALIDEHLPALARGEARPFAQDESKRRTFPQRGPADGLIDWNQDATDLHNFIRAQTRPYPGAFTIWRGRHMTVWSATTSNRDASDGLAVGEVIVDGDRLFVETGHGAIELGEVEIEGRAMSGASLQELAGAGILGT